ncbi:UV DNA damage repair endonuclease UvsE [Romboutsia sp. 1001216sp1]|uniref:UV DNA damage repair endonuclease UvsE n=1 Tax=Romboutsia TaxID=1501226 RepID=UPI000ABF81E6|nr:MULTISPECIES: UV DNA damage repair endonuclease UvsE [Romboutsia]MDB8792426.1 UV DNA damage repair endonuclease UvsE [Romboutsia sp. 1001216sp1]MDB8795721.1 UV DNA damage repair endonuclease UvsE [Romboutsia sp. 1001216sp1]MDB8798400.1 UV DNA damage repair endonuclease UvsE [Romboutsia sp. 1001216sp1]MDB8800886.1 UV DNA damage repair endonuclease UvsE [Romboutsia sp. 1001216sp1]MDB8812285.1 UV DNA damage repair endonuclease UvsE [Romboutsia sp. 1001216sp1]
MRIRLGYVAIALNLPKVTSSSTLTFKRYSSMNSDEERLNKLKKVTYSNIIDLEKILKYNIKNNIHFYRITSNLIPLATHPEVMWDYRKYFKKDFEYIGKIINDNNLRIDIHPDQFNVINTDRESVFLNTSKNLTMQANFLEDINCKDAKMVIHIGGAKGEKEKAIERFIENFNKLPVIVKNKLILENDDKIFTVKDVLYICKILNLPMVLDIHHHNCNNNGENIDRLLNDIFNTWKNEKLQPKIHFSTPREFENDRRHSDYIDAKEFLKFIYLIKDNVNKDVDVMIEAKKKDLALQRLVSDIKNLDKLIVFEDESTIIL